MSPELVFNKADPTKPIAHKRNQAAVEADGDFTRANPNSACVWHYEGQDLNGNGKLEPEETMHRTCGTVAIKDDILVVGDFCGIIHCLDAKTGKCHWTHDMLAASWASPLITDGKGLFGQRRRKHAGVQTQYDQELISKDADGNPGGIDMGSSIYSTPIVANGVLYISTRNLLFAIAPSGN